MTPLNLKRDGANNTIQCGKCPQCVARRTSAWSFRLTQEDKRSKSSLFLTLTYGNSNCPVSKKGYMVLKKRDIQLFIKRLRKANSKHTDMPAIKYYAVGEYGGRTQRPHYHIILFNAKLELIQPAWDLGQIHYGKVSGASIGYTLKYMCKTKRYPLHANDDRISEFALMSKDLAVTT